MIQTSYGPVSLRPPRPPEYLKLRGTSEDTGRPFLLVQVLCATGLQGPEREDGETEPVYPYCVCEVHGHPEVGFETPVRRQTAFPVWNYQSTIPEIPGTVSLTFTVKSADTVRDTTHILGHAALDDLHHGMDAVSRDLALLDGSARETGAVLKIRVEAGHACKITKNWLTDVLDECKLGEDGPEACERVSQLYCVYVKQALLVAAIKQRLEDLVAGYVVDEDGRAIGPEHAEAVERETKEQLQAMRMGETPVKVFVAKVHLLAKFGEKAVGELEKHVCTMRSEWALKKQQRYFTIDNGMLKIYKNNRANAKPTDVYELKDADAFIESTEHEGTVVHTEEEFLPDFTCRLCCNLAGRKSGCIMLYAGLLEVQRWERAVRLSKYLTSAQNCESMRSTLSRLKATTMFKGWEALFTYAKEMQKTKESMRSFALKIIRLDLSRAWTKARMVFLMRRAQEKRRQDEAEWAENLLLEKMHKLQRMPGRSLPQSRHQMITWVQGRFRRYKQQQMLRRSYACGPGGLATRVQQALGGFTMACSFRPLAREDALRLLINAKAYSELSTELKAFCAAGTPAYSENGLSLGTCTVSVNDMFSALSFTETGPTPARPLAQSWARFVNLDQISSVILHSERILAAEGKGQKLDASLCSGAWLTINGPRLCWCQRMRTTQDALGKEQKEVTGTADGLSLVQSLVRGEEVRWLRLSVSVKRGPSAASAAPAAAPPGDAAEAEKAEGGKEAGDGAGLAAGAPSEPPAEPSAGAPAEARPPEAAEAPAREPESGRPTSMVLHFLGRQFRTPKASGRAPVYEGEFVAEVPVPAGDLSLAALGDCDLSVQVLEYHEDGKKEPLTIWTGKAPLWELLSPKEAAQGPAKIGHVLEREQREAVSLATALRDGDAQVTGTLALNKPQGVGKPGAASATMELSITASAAKSQKPACVSPELLGRGPGTALFSSCRTAWYDPRLGSDRFSADRAANFAELRLRRLLFPAADKPGDGKLFRYHVEAKCSAVSCCSLPLLRPREAWKGVVSVDVGAIEFKDARLVLPLPPGLWVQGGPSPELELRVLRVEEEAAKAVGYGEWLARGNSPAAAPKQEEVYHAIISLDGMLLDQTYSGFRLQLSVSTDAPAMNILTARGQPARGSILSSRSGLGSARYREPAVLVLDATLRDREFVRLSARNDSDSRQSPVLCVGERAMLRVEELIRRPATDLERRHRLLPEQAAVREEAKTGASSARVAEAGPWRAPLREPFLVHEHMASGVDKLPGDRNQFKEKHIPTHVEDAIPHKFVLPPLEFDFLQLAKPGVYSRILDDLCAERTQDTSGIPVVVTHLTHLVRQVPCTVLATYADRTCDLELSQRFLRDWAARPDMQCLLPGRPVVGEPLSGQPGAQQLARLRRVFLRGVPLHLVASVQPTGFNIYNAALNDVEDVIKEPALSPGDLALGDCPLRAGPVPPDAGPACQCEWSLRLHAKSEGELRRFVAALRQSVQLCHFSQRAQVREARRQERRVLQPPQALPLGPIPSSGMGHLEVVLAEARHLRPVEFMPDLRSRVGQLLQAELNSFAAIKFADGDTGEDLEYRGVKEQVSSCVAGSNPSWSAVKETQHTGGFVFKSPPVDPRKMPNLYFELELKHRGINRASLGTVRMPVTRPPTSERPLRIALIGASGLRGAGEAGPAPNAYCVCRVEGRPLTEFRTKAVRGTSSPTWDHEVTMSSYEPGDALEFCVYSEDGGEADALLGAIVLEAQEFEADGLAGEVQLLEAEEGARPSIKLRIAPTAASLGGQGIRSLSDPERPCNNFWLPLSTPDPHAPGGLRELSNGCVHLVTLWVPERPSAARVARHLPTTSRGWVAHELGLRMATAVPREPVCGLQVRKFGYNPNVNRDWPATRCDAMGRHVEGMFDVTPYLACVGRQGAGVWEDWRRRAGARLPAPQLPASPRAAPAKPEEAVAEELDVASPRLHGLWCRDWPATAPPREPMLAELEELIRHGVPAAWRGEVWVELAQADLLHRDLVGRLAQEEAPQAGVGAVHPGVLRSYRQLVEWGQTHHSEALQQLQDDVVAAGSWEQSEEDAALDLHQRRLRCAQDVCTALIAFSREPSAGQEVLSYQDLNAEGGEGGNCGVAYCESLLVVAFFLLLSQDPTFPAVGDNGGSGAYASRVTRMFAKQERQHQQQTEAQALDAEVRAFLVLYALAGSRRNQAFREYYGAPKPSEDEVDGDQGPLCDGHGAMKDVYFLGVCLANHERDLWVHLAALGFQLATVFYGAFMRLYAFLLPTATLVRLWDVLLAQSSRPGRQPPKPARHILLDLAFGTLRACRTALLRCESAAEARDCLVGRLESMYDPSAMIGLMCDAETVLWQPPLGPPLQVAEAEKAFGLWEQHLKQIRGQNALLQELSRNASIPELGQEGGQPPADAGSGTGRLTVARVKHLAQALRERLPQSTVEGCYWGMLRQTPGKLRELGPPVEEGIMGKFVTIRNWIIESIPNCVPDVIFATAAVSLPADVGGPSEPTDVSEKDFVSAVRSCMGTAWAEHDVEAVHAAFRSPQERRFSLNEFLVALICCSRGSVGEKAAALFELYSSCLPAHKVPHRLPVAHAARAVLQRVEGGDAAEDLPGEGPLARAPAEQVVLKMALHLRVHVHGLGQQEQLLGEVYVPSLRPFLSGGIGTEEPHTFHIWGQEGRLSERQADQKSRADATARPCIGSLEMAIRWIADAEDRPQTGQLGLRLLSVKFDPWVESPELKNPRVSVVTYNGYGVEQPLERSNARGSFGKHIEFDRTMWLDPRGKAHHFAGCRDHGWDSQQRVWRWCEKYGTQFSAERSVIHNGWGEGERRAAPKAISLKACRLLTQQIFARSLHYITNRQAALIADEAFSRAGAVPGILDALLVQGEGFGEDCGDIMQLRRRCEKERRRCVDVRHQVVLMHEAQVSTYPGSMSLFPPLPKASPRKPSSAEEEGIDILPEGVLGVSWQPVQYDSLEGMRIPDPFPGYKKLLWIRFARAGDGQRFNTQIQVDEGGRFTAEEVKLDMNGEARDGQVQGCVTKEEFVSCLLASPLLSESLRQLSTCLPGMAPPSQELRLEVLLPAAGEEDMVEEDFEEAMNARQGVLLELWDSGSGEDADYDVFLGECWLPPLGTVTRECTAFVLPVGEAATTEDNMGRFDKRKRLRGKAGTGNLFVEASWELPAEHTEEGNALESMTDRVEAEERSHTGRLQIKIIKVEELRDWAGTIDGRAAYVSAYIRNEAFLHDETAPGFGAGGWRLSQTTGLHQEVLRTRAEKGTGDHVWEETFELLLKTASFEKRTALDGQRQRDELAERDVDGGEWEASRVLFGGQDSRGIDHGVQVYLGDSIQQFKAKLVQACSVLAARDRTPEMKARYEAVARGVPFSRPLEVFLEPAGLQALAQKGGAGSEDYARQLQLAEQDPDNWQPLDSLLCFGHYASRFGFGGRGPARLLRLGEADEGRQVAQPRRRAFEAHRRRLRQRWADMNTEEACYGYARFPHPGDGGSCEWRPALLRRAEAQRREGGGKRRFLATFLHTPVALDPNRHPAKGDPALELDEDSVLLAPRQPKILGSGFLAHRDFLAKARSLFEAGLSEKDITTRLNQEWQAHLAYQQPSSAVPSAQAGEVRARPPDIALSDVQRAVKHGV